MREAIEGWSHFDDDNGDDDDHGDDDGNEHKQETSPRSFYVISGQFCFPNKLATNWQTPVYDLTSEAISGPADDTICNLYKMCISIYGNLCGILYRSQRKQELQYLECIW